MYFRLIIFAAVFTTGLTTAPAVKAGEPPAAMDFKKNIQPVLEEYCYDCHGDGEKKGGVALDAFNTSTNFTEGRDVWWRVLKNLRAGLMPPPKKATADRRAKGNHRAVDQKRGL